MQEDLDKRLDIPAEANREKHINFREAEENALSAGNSVNNESGVTKEDEERRRQWQQGLEEGRKAASQNNG